METGRQVAIMVKAINTYGDRHQILKCIEEMSELTKELVKDLNGEGNREHIVEEYSDLTITLEEIAAIYEISVEEFEAIREQKLTRLWNRLKQNPIEHCDNSDHVDMAYEK